MADLVTSDLGIKMIAGEPVSENACMRVTKICLPENVQYISTSIMHKSAMFLPVSMELSTY
jgi:hypothetical protein